MNSTEAQVKRLVVAQARAATGLGPKAFADRLNTLVGPLRVPIRPAAIGVWETDITPPDAVVGAAAAIWPGSGEVWLPADTTDQQHVIDLDAPGPEQGWERDW
ncbi:hypothetical protein [Nocardia sp. NPDC057030]|uniref:hypothetical protein n=1 Tax=unclassified Nocardia TaxID=2637762 RepID=UPI00362800EE